MAPSTAVIAVTSAGAGILAGWVLRSVLRPSLMRAARISQRSRGSSEASQDADWSDENEDIPISDDGEYKMVIVIRNDLKMGKGKIAAQSCHAACGSVKKLNRYNPQDLQTWEYCGQPKIVTKVNNEAELLALAKKAQEVGLVSQLIRDAGRTQIAPGSVTALAVGPGPNYLVDQVTGNLKLL